MDRLTRRFRSIRPPPSNEKSGESTPKDDARQSYLAALENLWGKIKASNIDHQFNSESLASLGAVIQLSILENPPSGCITTKFFLPFTGDQVARFPVDITDPFTADQVDLHTCLWYSSKKDGRCNILGDAELLAAMIVSEFSSYARTPRGDRSSTLIGKTDWKRGDCGSEVFHPKFCSTLFSKEDWNPEDTWQVREGTMPHVMIEMVSGVIGHDKALLRGELLTLIATMITRLRSERLGNFNIIPVLLLSFMGPRKGRVLVAHFDESGLQISTSKLHDLSTETKGKLSVEFFLQWMTSRMTGNTVSEIPYTETSGETDTAADGASEA